MPSKKKKNKSQKRPDETRGAEAATVAWMLSMLATAIAELLVIGSWALALFYVEAGEEFKPLRTLPGLLLFLAVITGIVCLILGPIAQRFRKTKAPKSDYILSVAIGIAPFVNLGLFLAFTPN